MIFLCTMLITMYVNLLQISDSLPRYTSIMMSMRFLLLAVLTPLAMSFGTDLNGQQTFQKSIQDFEESCPAMSGEELEVVKKKMAINQLAVLILQNLPANIPAGQAFTYLYARFAGDIPSGVLQLLAQKVASSDSLDTILADVRGFVRGDNSTSDDSRRPHETADHLIAGIMSTNYCTE